MRRAALVSLALFLFSAAAEGEPSLVLLAGKVFTGDTARPWAEAVAIEGDRISAVGTTEEIKALAGARTEVIDLAGLLVIPGINDAHMHPGFAAPAFRTDLGMDPSRGKVEAAIHNAVEETTADAWIMFGILPVRLKKRFANSRLLSSRSQ